MNSKTSRGTAASVALIACLTAAAAPAHGQAGGSAGGTPLTLEQAVALAIEHNQAIRAQRLAIDQAKANEVTAGLKPNLIFTSVNADFPVFTPSQPTWSAVTLSESVSYTFERGGKRGKRVQVAQDATELTARTVNDAERQLRFQVAQAYVAALLAKSTLDLANESLKDFTEVVVLNQRRLASGDIAEGDYLKVALQKLQFEQDVSAGEVALVRNKAALRQLVGYETVPEDFELAGALARAPGPAPSLETLQREALAARPDLQAARTGTKLADDSILLAMGNRARDFTGGLEYDRNGPMNGMGFSFSFELPIHDRNQGEIARSQAAAKQAKESEAAVVVGVMTDVVSAYAGFRANEKVVALFESGYLEQARQSRDISTYAYQRGAGSLLDLLDAQRTYRGVQLAYRQALAAYMTSVAEIGYVVGRAVTP